MIKMWNKPKFSDRLLAFYKAIRKKNVIPNRPMIRLTLLNISLLHATQVKQHFQFIKRHFLP